MQSCTVFCAIRIDPVVLLKGDQGLLEDFNVCQDVILFIGSSRFDGE